MRIAVFVLVTLSLLSLTGVAAASVDLNQRFAAVKVTRPPDPKKQLDDPAWTQALKAQGFRDVTTRREAPLETTAYVVYDAKNLYVAFRCEQATAPIVAQQTTNNIGFGLDDYVAVAVDPSGNGAQVYYFFATPRGVRYQLASESSRYQPPWEANASVKQGEWTAVFTVPLKDLRARSGSWRFNFLRHVASVNENYSWAYNGLMTDTLPNGIYPPFTDARFWPALTDIQIGVSAARPQPRAEVYGLESFGHDRNIFQQSANTFGPQNARHVGVDFTYPFTNTVAFVGTLNPDFSNVEVDQQIIAPQEFPRVLTEYRPFFAQGAAFLNPNENFSNPITPPDSVFYTPNLGIFDHGAKIEGTFGLEALGILNAKGAGFNDTAFGFKHATDNKAFSWWLDGVEAAHTLGHDDTYELGFKGRNLLNGFVDGFDYAQENGTFVADVQQGRNIQGFVDVHQTHYEVNVSYQDIGPYYNPVDGFTNINDERGLSYFVDLPGSGGASIIKRFDFFMAGDRYLDRSGAVREADILIAPDITFKNLIHISGGPLNSELRFYQSGYPFYVGGTTEPFHTNTINLGYRDGTQTPLDLGYLYGPFSTFYLQQYTSSTSHPLGMRFSLGAEYDATRERFFAGGSDGQLLRRVSLSEALGAESNISIGLRSISGTGGLAQPGLNFSASYHRKFSNDNEMFVAFGTPASPVTLDRFIIKYLLRFGGGAGT